MRLEKLYEELYDLYFSPNTVRVTISRGVGQGI
jgi:hypothetical protein